MDRKKALVTGINGQDGAYLAQHLLNAGYKVYGAQRRTTGMQKWRTDRLGITKDIEYIDFELNEYSNIKSAIEKTQPDEIYNLAAQSFVHLSFEQPLYTSDTDYTGVCRILDIIKGQGIKFYQAGTSEMFGKVQEVPQKESTPFYPRSPYGVAKLAAYWITVNYRESYDMFGCNGILFNHESPLRGEEFVTRKIVRGLVAVKQGDQDYIELGNQDAQRDWGHAKDFTKAMHLMLQQDAPDDYVVAMGELHSVKDCVDMTCARLGLDPAKVVKTNPKFLRPAEVDLLIGDPTKAKEKLGWAPEYSFETLLDEMVSEETKYYKS